MKLTRFAVNNYKALKEIDFELGSVNVFIGTNGVGKSSVLEAIGILSASVNDRVDDESLYRRGVRLGTPKLYKSSFKAIDRLPNTIEFAIDWSDEESNYRYKVNLSNSTDNPEPCWSYFSESLTKDGINIPELTRGQSPKSVSLNNKENNSFDVDKYRGILTFFKNTSKTAFISGFYDMFKDYAVYTPSTDMLRGVSIDVSQKRPIGLHGGRLAEAISDLMNVNDDMFGTMDVEDLYELLDWVKEIEIGKPQKDMVPTGVPTPQRVIQFTDKYMKPGNDRLSSYDASEGALYVLFVLTLSLHPYAPKAFAIDNFDQAMNPRLARATMKCFCENVIANNKYAFVTTHNPLVLDGLDLLNPQIKLFTMDRTKNGFASITPVQVDEKLSTSSLSTLWLSGALGGVPNL